MASLGVAVSGIFSMIQAILSRRTDLEKQKREFSQQTLISTRVEIQQLVLYFITEADRWIDCVSGAESEVDRYGTAVKRCNELAATKSLGETYDDNDPERIQIERWLPGPHPAIENCWITLDEQILPGLKRAALKCEIKSPDVAPYVKDFASIATATIGRLSTFFSSDNPQKAADLFCLSELSALREQILDATRSSLK